MKRFTFLISVFLIISLTANAQGWLNKLGDAAKNAAKNAVENRVVKKAGEETNKALDKVEGKTTKTNKTTDSKKQIGQEEDIDNQDQKSSSKDATQSLSSYSKYDFIPGEKVIFFDDFSQDAVGDFPDLWNTNGSAEVVTTNLYPGNWMKFVMDECVWTDQLLKLPENYTIEFDVIPIGGLEGDGMSGYHFRLMQAVNAKAWDSGSAPGNGGFEYNMEYYGIPRYNTWFGYKMEECNKAKISGNSENENVKQKINTKYHIAIWVQKTRIRLYQNETKVFDLPRAFPSGCVNPDRLRFESGAAMISNVRVAVGTPDMRNKLITEGRLVTYGIYFDVNKDVVKPESYGTLKEIASILNEVPDVNVKIVGHTDSDGSDASNLDLSKRRAASVKNELVKNFNVNEDRLTTDGAGETQPVAKNDTPANKALNRRVEFIKQ